MTDTIELCNAENPIFLALHEIQKTVSMDQTA